MILHPIIDLLKRIVVDLPEYVKPSGGEEVFVAPLSGALYKKDMVLNITVSVSWEIPLAFSTSYLFSGATNMETITISAPSNGVIPIDNNRRNLFENCSSLRSVVLDFAISYFSIGATFSNCTSLETVQIGNVGKGAQGNSISTSLFTTCPNLQTITIYVNAEDYADIPSEYTSKQPFGAPNASVVYRSATTGEVITP